MGTLLWEIRRYLRHPLCLLGHKKPDPCEIGTDGNTLDYYCGRCQKVIKSVPIDGNIDFLRFKRLLEMNGWDWLDAPESHTKDS